ncbi:peptidase inhibitor family I36 protein [Streptomyces sp. NPDC015130]|uniref:peptidase inhibitor family I36 protein n=1 Tax=Streptomyces sp. NPDC015130 TaxID=3364940 RepID=UPI0036F81CAD
MVGTPWGAGCRARVEPRSGTSWQRRGGGGYVPACGARRKAAVSDCPTGYFCAWGDTGSTGPMFKTQTSKATLGTWDNKFRLIINRTPGFACTFDEPNFEDGAGRYENDGLTTSIASRSVSSVKIVPTIRECDGTAYPHWLSETSPTAAGFGDMNGDRQADVLVRDLVGQLWFLDGDGNGKLVGSGGWNGMNALVGVGDMNGDGRADLYAREASTGKLWLYPGKLGSRVLVGGGWNGMTMLIGNGDWSGDGKADLIATQIESRMLYRYEGNGTGRLGASDWLGGGDWWDLNGAF